MATKKQILKDVLSLIEPFIETFDQSEARMAFAAVLYEKALEMGGTKRPDDETRGFIDENTILAFDDFVDKALLHLKILQAVIQGKVRMHFENSGQVRFSQRQLENALEGLEPKDNKKEGGF